MVSCRSRRREAADGNLLVGGAVADEHARAVDRGRADAVHQLEKRDAAAQWTNATADSLCAPASVAYKDNLKLCRISKKRAFYKGHVKQY